MKVKEVEKFECFDCGCYYWIIDRNDFQCPNCEQNDNYII
jgi:rubrerythrin